MVEGPSASIVVITRGDRNDALRRLAASLDADRAHELLVLGNGASAPSLAGWTALAAEQNLGVSGGRREAARHATGDVLLFLDDDCAVLTSGLINRVLARFEAEADLGALALRIVVSGTDKSLRHWQPRLGSRGELVAGDVTTFLGGGHAIRRTAYEQVGAYHPDFFYSHEETELSWRLLDAGWRIAYAPELTIEHPATEPDRNPDNVWHGARNRVWIARERLPLPLAVAYLGLWVPIQLSRVRSIAELKATTTGTLAGLRQRSGPRRPMQWRTAWRMARLGRPPLV